MLYIPITEASLNKLSQPDADAKSIVTSLCPEELAALLLVQGVPKLWAVAKSGGDFLLQVERNLSGFIESCYHFSLQELQNELVNTLNVSQVLAGRSLLEKAQVFLMTAEQIREKKYLKWDEKWVWDWEFKKREQSDFFPSRLLNKNSSSARFVSNEQERIVSILLSDRNESIDIQGYAGSGKTTIISYLAEELKKEKPLFITETKDQALAIKEKIKNVQVTTFWGIAYHLVQKGLLQNIKNINGRFNKQYTSDDKYIYTDKQLAEKLEFYDIGNYRREAIAKHAQDVVKNFCLSDDSVITRKHIPKWYAYQLTPIMQEALLTFAKHLWDMLCIPRDGIRLPIRNYHLVKALALNGMGILRDCTHIIVDETHNLSAAIIQILKQSSQPVFTFGDYYQSLDGLAKEHNWSSTLRKNILPYSIRVGENMESIYNQLIEHHPITPVIEFSGNKAKKTDLIYYKKFEIPNRPCTILVHSFWSVFWIVYTLHEKHAKYYIPESQRKELDWLINGAISFLNSTEGKPKNYEFSNSNSWSDFIENNRQKEPALDSINDWIHSEQLNPQKLNTILRNSTSKPQDDTYLVRRVWDCRNIEFNRVFLLNDVIGKSGVVNDNYAKTISHIYTGISRAKDEIYIPEGIKNWIDAL